MGCHPRDLDADQIPLRGLKDASNRDHHRLYLWLMVAVTLAGVAARVAPLTDNRFHGDEALFSTLARLIATGRDPWLSHTVLLVDKPPLSTYLLAGSMALMGASEFSARLPNLLAGVISIALTGRLAWQLWRSRGAALVALTVLSLSPFAILFSPTAFTDPLMVMWLLAACAAICQDRWGWSGVLCGLALATKQNALFCIPLPLLIGIVNCATPETRRRDVVGWLVRFFLGIAIVSLLVMIWDTARTGAASVLASGFQANNPGRLARSDEVWTRGLGWLSWLRYFGGSWALDLALAGLSVPLLALELRFYPRTRSAASTLSLLTFLLGYLAFHWLVAFPVLDRYLLPLVPVAALLTGRGIMVWADRLPRHIPAFRRFVHAAAAAGLVVSLALPALRAAQSGYPVGGDHGAFDGIDQIASYLRIQPWGTVVYTDSLGWHLEYYLFDAVLNRVDLLTPAQLESDLRTFGKDRPARYLVLWQGESHDELLYAVEQAGCRAGVSFVALNRWGEESMTTYRIRCDLQ